MYFTEERERETQYTELVEERKGGVGYVVLYIEREGACKSRSGVTGRISFRQIVWAELVSRAAMEWHLQLSHATLRRLPRYITLHLSPNGYPLATLDVPLHPVARLSLWQHHN